MSPSQSSDLWLSDLLCKLSTLSLSDPIGLHSTSSALLATFRPALSSSNETFLPSYVTSLPNGSESGTAVALDLGGSTLRIAVIHLAPSTKAGPARQEKLEDVAQVVKRRSWHVSHEVKQLPASDFFDWIAKRIGHVLRSAGKGTGEGMKLGVTWSFPVEQTSRASGKVQQMGKGYMQWHEIQGTDLRSHFEDAIRRQGLTLTMTSLFNDTGATLLSHAYINPATRISLILGTGCNMAIHLPATAFSRGKKLRNRSHAWRRSAKGVLVNTEVSMFGTDIFPVTETDRVLDRQSLHPGYQPLEYLSSGRYLGEIVRIAIVEGVSRGVLFGGLLPGRMEVNYGLDTSLLSDIESQPDEEVRRILIENFDFQNPPTAPDIAALRAIAIAIAQRAALYIALTIFTLWRLRQEAVSSAPQPTTNEQDDQAQDTEAGSDTTPPTTIAVAFCGAVVEKHHSFRRQCQEALNVLVQTSPSSENGRPGRLRQRLVLEHAADSGLLGAAVGAMMADGAAEEGKEGVSEVRRGASERLMSKL
ncbi:hypothetical protein MMC25_002627 [Agyrium rufum]|nr:hypothetical protein [Agyrium rufum]